MRKALRRMIAFLRNLLKFPPMSPSSVCMHVIKSQSSYLLPGTYMYSAVAVGNYSSTAPRIVSGGVCCRTITIATGEAVVLEFQEIDPHTTHFDLYRVQVKEGRANEFYMEFLTRVPVNGGVVGIRGNQWVDEGEDRAHYFHELITKTIELDFSALSRMRI